MTISEILKSNDAALLRELFSFDTTQSNAAILVKFNVFARWFFPLYFGYDDAPFHEVIDLHNLLAYRGELVEYVDIAFRDAAKTARTKLFIAYCILNDTQHFRHYIKVLAEDGTNSTQIVTDIYNMLVNPRVTAVYPSTFAKTVTKREETMSSFTTAEGSIKVLADTVGTEQRGALQDYARPDFIWFEDFENRTTLRSLRITRKISENMEEARTSLAKGGACIYTCNYLSEQGNVHPLVKTKVPRKVVTIFPIMDENGTPAWPAKHTRADIDMMKERDQDFEGERMCKPSSSKDIYFDRETIEKYQIVCEPKRTVANFKIFREYDPSHRYGSGHDVGGGVGLDSSTSVFIDFDTIPAQVVATYHNNLIQPSSFGDEVHRQGEFFSNPITALERNYGDSAILRARQLEVNLYAMPSKEATKINAPNATEYGWHTNALTKMQILSPLKKALYDNLIALNDLELIEEVKSYTLNDLYETNSDPRQTTRHFDLVMALAIAWHMKEFASVAPETDTAEPENQEDDLLYPQIGM